MPGILCTHLAALTGFDSVTDLFPPDAYLRACVPKNGTFSTAIGSILKGSPHEKIHLLPALALLTSACSSMLPKGHNESSSFHSFDDARQAVKGLLP
jgi:hypothetical protein